LNITLDNQKVLSTGALILAIIILLGALGLALWPAPNIEAQSKVLKNNMFKAVLATKKAQTSTLEQQKVALTQTWSGSGNEIGPTAYQNINKIATALNVKIEGFRAQRVTDAGDVSQIPFVLNAEGSFVNVLEFVHKIETTPTKLAVEMLQLGASDESSDQVTATIGLEAYVLNATTTSSTTTTTTSTTKISKSKAVTPALKVGTAKATVTIPKKGGQ
jgi:hypothetical protein